MNRILRLDLLAWLSFCGFFLLGLVFKKISNISFYLLLLAGIVYAFQIRWKHDGALSQIWKRYTWVYIAAATMLLALLIHDMVAASSHIRDYDIPSRVAFLGLLTLAAASIPTVQAKRMRWFFMLGTLLATVKLALMTHNGAERLPVIDFISIIALSQLTLLLAVFAVLSIIWCEKRNWLTVSLAMITAVTGLYSVYISQTRGAWIAIPFFVILACIVFLNQGGLFKKISSALILIALLAGFFSTTSIVRDRVNQGFNDIQQYEEKVNPDTSLGIRLQLWKASWHIFVENPVLGVGGSNFAGALKNLAQQGMISPDAATFPHSHNEVLFSMATYGMVGLIAILATYFVPLYIFVQEMQHSNREIVAAAAMGASLCIGYIIFGLVDVMFMWRICDIFYVICIAFFLGFIIRKRHELQQLHLPHLHLKKHDHPEYST